MGFETIVERIRTLPPLPESVRKLEELFLHGEPDMKAIVSVIETDPVLTADILAKVNAPIYSYSKQIVSVMQAVTLFGLGTVRGMVLRSSMEKKFDIDMSPYGISSEELSKISSMQSALMFQWYMGIDVQKARILVPVAFLMEMGKVVIAKELIESSYGEIFRDELSSSDSIERVEREFTETTSAGVSAMLFKHWFFDETFIGIMKYVDADEEVTPEYADMVNAMKVIRKAVNIKEQMSDRSIEEAAQLVAELGHESKRFTNAANRVRDKFV